MREGRADEALFGTSVGRAPPDDDLALYIRVASNIEPQAIVTSEDADQIPTSLCTKAFTFLTVTNYSSEASMRYDLNSTMPAGSE